MEKLSADALRLALVTASMEYYRNDNCSYNQGHDVSIRVWLDGEIGRRPRFKLWCPEMDVWVRIPLKLLIIKGRRIYERTIRRIKETV